MRCLSDNRRYVLINNDLLARFGSATELPAREWVVKALFNKGGRLGALGRSKHSPNEC